MSDDSQGVSGECNRVKSAGDTYTSNDSVTYSHLTTFDLFFDIIVLFLVLNLQAAQPYFRGIRHKFTTKTTNNRGRFIPDLLKS